jgi:hypothetical protein
MCATAANASLPAAQLGRWESRRGNDPRELQGNVGRGLRSFDPDIEDHIFSGAHVRLLSRSSTHIRRFNGRILEGYVLQRPYQGSVPMLRKGETGKSTRRKGSDLEQFEIHLA